MISGLERVLAVGLAMLPLAVSADETFGLDDLMTALHGVKSASAHFVERKYVAMLNHPVEASGTLRYMAPDQLDKVTLAPVAETIGLRGGKLVGTRRNGRHYRVELDDHPEVASLVESIRATLAGDRPTLERYYTVALAGDRDAWRLTLQPRDADVRERVDDIVIGGADSALKTVEIHEHDGDRSEMVITADGP